MPRCGRSQERRLLPCPLHVWCNRLRRAIKSDSTMRAPRCRGRQRAIPLRRRGSNSVSGLLSITRHKNELEAITHSDCRGLLRAARCTRSTHGHFQPSRCRRRRLVNSVLNICQLEQSSALTGTHDQGPNHHLVETDTQAMAKVPAETGNSRSSIGRNVSTSMQFALVGGSWPLSMIKLRGVLSWQRPDNRLTEGPINRQRTKI